MTYQELFIDNKDVLIIHKSLANILGDLNEAVVLNQLNYWIERYKETNHNFKDGKYWVYNSYKQWAIDNFPFWSETTVKRTFTRLENKGIVVSANYNKMSIDKTKWYSIDYEKLQEYVDKHTKDQNEERKDHKDLSTGQNDLSSGHNDRTIPKTTTNNTNIDYITDTKEKGENINKVNGQVKTSVSGKKQMRTQKSAKQRYLDKKADEFEMLNSILIICSSNYDEQVGNEIFKSLEYYFERYTKKTGLIHPILKQETLEDIIDKMANYSDMEYYHFGNIADQEGAFIKIIDAFFDGDFGSVTGQRTNWHLPHFMSDGVLDRLAQRVWERGEVY